MISENVLNVMLIVMSIGLVLEQIAKPVEFTFKLCMVEQRLNNVVPALGIKSSMPS